jgi:enamine deaminase RidA (YjgF/YER057c/UK114 family)
MAVRERLEELGITLPPPPQPVASYVQVAVSGGLAFVAGQLARVDGQLQSPGKLGAQVSVEEGRAAARQCALQALAALEEALGDLDRIERIVQVTVFVASAEGFTDQPQVANGASDLLIEVFGDAGRHARAAVGVAELPLGGPVEVAVIASVGE